ncbi:MAG TPA: MFS transporter [Capillimicrobium sp.]|nr:MFS transporter [Capillimicrobium sp.]
MRRLVLLASAIVLVDTMFYAVVAPLLPHYADELHLSKAAAGILAAAYGAGTLVGSLPAGAFAARFGARPTVFAGLALLGGSSVAFGFSENVVVLDLARFVQGVGGACSWAGTMAWLIESAPPSRRGEMIGTALGAAIGGALFGPVVGAVAEATAPEIVFGSVLVIAGGLAAWAASTPPPPASEPQGLGNVAHALHERRVIAGMWLVALPAAGFGVVGVLGPLRLDDLGASAAVVGATFLVAAAVEAIVSPIVGRISDRRGRVVPVRAGLAATVVLLLLFTLPGAILPLAALLVVTTAAMGFFWAPAMAMLSDAAERSGVHQGLAFGLVNLAWAIGQVSGSAGGGALAKATTDATATAAVAAAALLTLVALTRLRGRAGAAVPGRR